MNKGCNKLFIYQQLKTICITYVWHQVQVCLFYAQAEKKQKKPQNSSSTWITQMPCLLFCWNFAERWEVCSCIKGWADFFPTLMFPCRHHITQNTLTANNSKNPGGLEKKTPPAGPFVIICHLRPSLSCVCKQTRYLPLTETLVASSAFPEQKLSTICGWIVCAGGVISL